MKKFVVSILLFFFCFSVSAAEAKFYIGVNEAHLNDSISLSLESSENEIELSYDQNVFEVLESNDFNQDVTITKENHTFYLQKPSKLKINLKVKEDAVLGKTKIVAKYGNESFSKEIEILGENTLPLALIYGIIAVGFILVAVIYFNVKKSKMGKKEMVVLACTSLFAFAFFILSILNLDFLTPNLEENNVKYMITIDKKEEPEQKEETGIKEEEVKDDKDETESLTPLNVTYHAVLNTYKTDTTVVEKEDEFVITFSVSVTPNIDVAYVVINNKTYSVWKNGDSYQVKVKSSNQYGENNFTITSVILKNGKQIEVENKKVRINA